MADSEDENDRKGRDKFRRERSDYSNDRKYDRRSWKEDHYDGRRRSRDEEEDRDCRRKRYPPSPTRGHRREWSPPMSKRFRHEPGWERLHEFGNSIISPYGMMDRRGPWMASEIPPVQTGIVSQGTRSSDIMGFSGGDTSHQHGSTVMSFKQFLVQQEDDIDDVEAIKLYHDYKADCKKKQLLQFFNDHKEENWFLIKYHPLRLAAIQKDTLKHLSNRAKVFHSLLKDGKLHGLELCIDKSDSIVRLMDTAVILMEGGTEHDLLALDIKHEIDPDISEDPASDDKPAEDSSSQEQEETGKDRKPSEVSDESSNKKPDDDSCNDNESSNEVQCEVDNDTQPRSLHLTKAVYIRHISPTVAPSDILEICKTVPGYLRMAFAEPQPEKGYECRGWVTYSAEANIKDLCTKLNAKKINDCQLICQVNRDLTRRVKVFHPATWSKKAVQSDIKILIKLIDHLDKRGGLWQHVQHDEQEGSVSDEEADKCMETTEINPVLVMPNDLFVDSEQPNQKDGEADDDEGLITDPDTEILSSESLLISTLDILLWYLRLVHSIDYYNGTIFADEDNMPHRCGIITARPTIPEILTIEEVNEYITGVETKIAPLMTSKTSLTDDEMEKLGRRDEEAEIEKFIEVNTQKLGENKYLCPLSGKKFKGPAFVRKHIFNKHGHAVEEVKHETEFFNNYLKDPERPVPLTNSSSGNVVTTGNMDDASAVTQKALHQTSSWRGRDPMMMSSYSEVHNVRFPTRSGRKGHRGGGRGSRGRLLRQYKDLDAPDDMY